MMNLPGIMVLFLASGVSIIAASYLPWYHESPNPKSREPRMTRRVEMRISGGIFLLAGVAIFVGLIIHSQGSFWTVISGVYEPKANNISYFKAALGILALAMGGSALVYGVRMRSGPQRDFDNSSKGRVLMKKGWLSLLIGAFLLLIGIVIFLLLL